MVVDSKKTAAAFVHNVPVTCSRGTAGLGSSGIVAARWLRGIGRLEIARLLDMRPHYDRRMPQHIEFSPIGMVHSPVVEAVDDIWGGVKCRIDLDSSRFTPDCLLGLADFSHVEIIFFFHRVTESEIVTERVIRAIGLTFPGSASSRNGERIGPTVLVLRFAACCPLKICLWKSRVSMQSMVRPCWTSRHICGSLPREVKYASPNGLINSCADTGEVATSADRVSAHIVPTTSCCASPLVSDARATIFACPKLGLLAIQPTTRRPLSFASDSFRRPLPMAS